MAPLSFRARIFLALLLLSLLPALAMLGVGVMTLREIVLSTGSAGAWSAVAESGQEVLVAIEGLPNPPPEMVEIAARHRTQLAESVRFSRLYALLGERILVLLPPFALSLALILGGLAYLTARSLGRALTRPVDDLVTWARSLGQGAPLPPVIAGEEEDAREFVELRQALRQASMALEEARVREAEQIRQRSWASMARRVAHELKNPLTPMRWAADRVAASEDTRTAEAGGILLEEINRLDEMARSFSLLGHEEVGPLAPVDLVALLEELVRRLDDPEFPLAADLPGAPVLIQGELHLLEGAVRNLVVNAQEATRSHSGGAEPPVVDSTEAGVLLRLREGPGEILLSVLDRGSGVPSEDRARIWEPEFTTKRRGTGLGLPLVRQAVELHGGEIDVFTREGGGSEFRIRLPSQAI